MRHRVGMLSNQTDFLIRQTFCLVAQQLPTARDRDRLGWDLVRLLVFHGSPRINLQNRRFLCSGICAPTGVAGALRQWRRCGRDADIDPWEHLLGTAVAFVMDELTTEPKDLRR